jgi:acyl dehydratase
MEYFEDFDVGFSEISPAIEVDRAEMVAYAAFNDPWPIHVDERVASATAHGELIASFGYVVTLFFRMIHTLQVNQGDQAGFLGGLGWQVKFVRAVKGSDRLRLKVTIKSKRLTSAGDRGIVVSDSEVLNQRDEPVVTIEITSMYLCRPESSHPDG